MKIKSLSIVILLFVVLVGGLGFSSEARAVTFSDVDLGMAGSTGLNLGIFVTGPTKMHATYSGNYFDANLGLDNGANTSFTGGWTMTGTLYQDPGATVQSNIGKFTIEGGITTQSLAQAVSDVRKAAANASSLTANQTINRNISNGQILDTNVGVSNVLGGHSAVIDINGNITITSSKNLTISGGANDWIIINVNGDIKVTSGGSIALAGGIPASHVLFNVEGTHDIAMIGQNPRPILNATFLAPNDGQKITLSPAVVNGAIIAYEISISSGTTIIQNPFIADPVPLPPSGLLLGSGLLGLGLLGYRRKRRC